MELTKVQEEKIEKLAKKIVNEIHIYLEEFEPTDNQGYSMEGTVVYKGQEYHVYLAFECEMSYEEQAALWIAEEIISHENNVVATKEQEIEALEKIKEIVYALGKDSYVGHAFDGCFEIANDNIENDFFNSVRGKFDNLSCSLSRSEAEVRELKAKLEKVQKEKERLQKELDNELELVDYELEENVKQKDYERLINDSSTKYLTDDEAKNLLYDWYGFAKEKIVIHHSVPKYKKDRHNRLHKIGEFERKAAYNATDWNYIRFDCGQQTYELHDDNLSFFFH